ncbi:TetR/AcrR family transcriptional regulator [Actinomadura atramentaria]|uniref:TetR/AcrR family transcriptional regulator n=1 Tax=Actinomadura atramentaria TaxID=1990 RepID=UPI000379DD91|nr:TetR/AcrR family transcriptional regulator [Actinomadura atramentaria]
MPERRRQERWERTRAALLDAAVTCLVEDGYAETTLQRVQNRAGVSRGALLHHFGSKAELLVAAIHHIAERQVAYVRGKADALPPERGRVEAALALLREVMSGPLFLAGLELWLAARTDRALRDALVPAEREIGRAVHDLLSDAFPHLAEPGRAGNVWHESLLALLRGLALSSVLRDDRAIEDAVLRLWADQVLRPRD